MDANPCLDPFLAMQTFYEFRKRSFGDAEELPVFLCDNGAIYSHSQFNKDLANILSLYPQLETSRDMWQGHSFRSGISTLLSLLGFDKEQIQKWGRWSSDAYLCYLKDDTAGRNVQDMGRGIQL